MTHNYWNQILPSNLSALMRGLSSTKVSRSNFLEIERACVLFRVPMRPTIQVPAAALQLYRTNFLVADFASFFQCTCCLPWRTFDSSAINCCSFGGWTWRWLQWPRIEDKYWRVRLHELQRSFHDTVCNLFFKKIIVALWAHTFVLFSSIKATAFCAERWSHVVVGVIT